MSKINLNSKAHLNALDAEILEALKGIAKKYDITFSPAGGTLGMTNAILKFRITNNNLSEAAKRSVITDFEMYGIEQYYNRTVRSHDGREVFKVTGINHAARKNPVVLTRPGGGNGAKCPVSYLKRCTIID